MYDAAVLLELLFHRETRSPCRTEGRLMPVVNGHLDDAADPELDYRALTEYMSVLDDGDARSRGSPGLYPVTSESGSQYLVDAGLPACECPDFRYRSRTCKHIRRVMFAIGWRTLPGWIEAAAVDPQLGLHVENGGNGTDV